MERFLLLLYLSCLSLTSAFALTSTVTVPVFLSLISVLLFFFSATLYKNRSLIFEIEDLFIIGFLLILYFSFILNSNHFKSNKPINHLFAYSYVIIINYFMIKNIYYNFHKIYGDKFIRSSYGALYWGLLITCLFGVIEFCLKNLWQIDIDSFIPRPAVTEYEPLALSSFIRLRSFAEESGHLAYFIEVFAPLSLYYSKNNRLLFFPLLFLTISCLLLSFSTAGWLIVAATFGILSIGSIDPFHWGKSIQLRYKSILKYLLLLTILVYIIFLNQGLIIFISDTLEEIILFKITYSGSAADRSARFIEGYNALQQSNHIKFFFGNGPAVYDTLGFARGGTILLYLTFALESGLIGLLLFLVFCSVILFKTIHLKNKSLRYVLLFGFISSMMHFFIISNYWYPWFWVLVIIIQINYRAEYNQNMKDIFLNYSA